LKSDGIDVNYKAAFKYRISCRWPGTFIGLRKQFTESIICFAQHYKTAL